jgi:uncharacterized iron-regulated membrane protein
VQNYNNEHLTMTSGLFAPGLKGRYVVATAGVAAGALLVAGALLYADRVPIKSTRSFLA